MSGRDIELLFINIGKGRKISSIPKKLIKIKFKIYV